MGCCVSNKKHQVTCHELDSNTDRNMLFGLLVENTALKKKIQDVSAEADRTAEELHLKIVLVSAKLEVEIALKPDLSMEFQKTEGR